MDRGEETAVFPIREYWMDIGQMDDFRQANGQFDEVFR
jgi:NDP-sugar pyrophosphorylase family protein